MLDDRRLGHTLQTRNGSSSPLESIYLLLNDGAVCNTVFVVVQYQLHRAEPTAPSILSMIMENVRQASSQDRRTYFQFSMSFDTSELFKSKSVGV